jgi:hypothetical protein
MAQSVQIKSAAASMPTKIRIHDAGVLPSSKQTQYRFSNSFTDPPVGFNGVKSGLPAHRRYESIGRKLGPRGSRRAIECRPQTTGGQLRSEAVYVNCLWKRHIENEGAALGLLE